MAYLFCYLWGFSNVCFNLYFTFEFLYLNGMRNIIQSVLKKKNLQFTFQLDCPTQTLLSVHWHHQTHQGPLTAPLSQSSVEPGTMGLVLRGQKVAKDKQVVFSKLQFTRQGLGLQYNISKVLQRKKYSKAQIYYSVVKETVSNIRGEKYSPLQQTDPGWPWIQFSWGKPNLFCKRKSFQ